MRIIKLFTFLSLLFGFGFNSYAQCAYAGSADFCANLDASTFTVGVPNSLCGTTWGNEHDQVDNMTAGCTYRIETCGTVYDTEVTVFADGGGSALAYSGSGCGDDVSLDFIPSSNGSYEFQLNQQGCAVNTSNPTWSITLVSCPASCTDPSVPSALSASINPVCSGNSTTLSWTGTLNDATAWHIYTGSCGGTQIGTSASNSFSVSPTTTTTYYIRGEDGAGCVDESSGSCGQVTVTVNTNSSITSVTSSANNICPSTAINLTANGVSAGTSATLTWYTGTGGTGTNLGTGNPKSVTPTSNTTYYARLAGTCNTVEQSIAITATDATAPSAVCQNITVFLDGAGNATITAADLDGGSTDNCGGVTLGASQTSFTCADIGINNVTLIVTDGSANTANCVATVTVVDSTSPVASCQNISVFLDGSGNATITAADIDGGSSDNCGGVTLGASQTAFTCADIGANNVTLTATDGSGNSANCIATVTIADSTSPVASCQNITVFLDGSGNVTIAAADIDGGSSDNCGGVTLGASQTSFTCADIGANNVTLTVTDGSANTANCVATVTVSDTTSPTITCPSDIVQSVDASVCTAAVTSPVPTGGDNCSILSIINDFNGTADASDTYPFGTTTVTWTITDNNGNTSTCTQNITITGIDEDCDGICDNVDAVVNNPAAYRGNMLTFNGTNYVSIGNVPELNFSNTDAFTIESWVKTGSANFQTIFSKMEPTPSFTGYLTGIDAGKGYIYIANDEASSNFLEVETSTNVLADNEWHHLAITYSGNNDASGITIYVDGVSQPLTTINNTLSNNIQNTSSAYIGVENPIIAGFQGSIDELRIWNAVRTQTEIRENRHLSLNGGCEAGIIGYFKFNETSGSTSTDLSSSGNDGTQVGTPTLESSTAHVSSGISTTHNMNATATTYNSPSTTAGHDIDLSFATTHPNGEVVVTFLEEGPVGGAPAGALIHRREDELWIVNNYGTTSSGLDGTVRFNYPDNWITSVSLASYNLHKRASNSTGAWIQNNAFANAASTVPSSNYIEFGNLTDFSMLFPSSQISLLPISEISLNAKPLNSHSVSLDWHYNISQVKSIALEKSIDGTTWNSILSLESKEDLHTFIDVNPSAKNYYRLTIFTENGDYKSQIQEVIMEDQAITIYPNPSNGTVNIAFKEYTEATVEIIDITGRVIQTHTTDPNELIQSVFIYQKGLFVIKVKTTYISSHHKVIIE